MAHANRLDQFLDDPIDKCPPDVKARAGMGLEEYSFFISPWAQSFEEEVFFDETVKKVGQVNKRKMSYL